MDFFGIIDASARWQRRTPKRSFTWAAINSRENTPSMYYLVMGLAAGLIVGFALEWAVDWSVFRRRKIDRGKQYIVQGDDDSGIQSQRDGDLPPAQG